jgi:hypothetical protein
MKIIEFYQRHLAYEYWSPDLQRMAFQSLDRNSAGQILTLCILAFALFNGIPILAWLVAKYFKDKGKLSLGKFKIIRRIALSMVLIGTLFAINTTNNIWLAACN